MNNVPQFITGCPLNEPFFDSVVKRAGGTCLLDVVKPPLNTKNVDYLIDGFALELKILCADTLDAPERQRRIKEFIRTEFPRGPLWISPTKQEARIVGSLADRYWTWILGKPVQDRLDAAADQIADTKTFVPGPLRGAVLIVNAGGPSLDWKSFTHLANHYATRFEHIDAVFAMSGVPWAVTGGSQYHFATIGKEGHRAYSDALGIKLGAAIVREVQARTGLLCVTGSADANGPSEKVTFRLLPSGFRKVDKCAA